MRRTDHGSHYYKATVIFRRQQQQQRQIFSSSSVTPQRKSSKRSCCCCNSSAGIDSRLPQQLWPSFFLFYFLRSLLLWRVVLRRGVVSVRIPLVTLKTCIICHFPAFYFLFSFPAIADDPDENKTGKEKRLPTEFGPPGTRLYANRRRLCRCASRSQPRGRRGGGRKVRRWRRHRQRKWKIAAAAVGQTKRVVNFQGEIKLKAS
jgi:hypothetical protein